MTAVVLELEEEQPELCYAEPEELDSVVTELVEHIVPGSQPRSSPPTRHEWVQHPRLDVHDVLEESSSPLYVGRLAECSHLL